MSSVYVIHKVEDRRFVETAVLCPLPALGFDEWLSAPILEERDDPALFEAAVENGPATLAVVSRSAVASDRFRRQVDQALASSTPCIPIYVGLTPEEVPWLRLATRQAIAIASADDLPAVRALWRTLASQLPEQQEPTEGAAGLSTVALRIEWSEKAFSYLLATAMGRQDFTRGEVLVRAFSRHNSERSTSYDAEATKMDLDALRSKRQFLLIRDYASAVLRLSPDNFRVRRQLAQALIELGELDRAEDVLRQLVRDAPATHDESYEGRGLLGRINKQRYVNERDPTAGKTSILAAIESYRSVFDETNKHTWHGVNAASLILRAARDGITGPSPDEARRIAAATLKVLTERQEATVRENLVDPEKAKQREGAELYVWDYASRVEALIALERFDDAGKALEDYLDHPGMDAFEVSSTFRQFDEVLQLSTTDKGRPLLERLWRAAERFRTGGLTQPAGGERRAMLVRVSNPDWQPTNVPDLEVRTQFGTVLSILGSDATVRALLKDPVVQVIEESRPAYEYESEDPLTFVNAIPPFQDLDGHDYSENGDHTIVAIIDDGIDVLHEAFLDDKGQCRIVGIWDQRDGAGPPPAGFTFGRYYSREEIAGFLATKTVSPSLGRNKDGHGTHVASIAAGRAVGNFKGGVAPAASLLVVISSSDQPTGYSDSHIAALKFIDQVATDRGLPVVVNVSQGMNAGAHDGRSALELGFEQFCVKSGRVVVKSAGNEREDRHGQSRGGHARVPPLLTGAVEPLIWRCQPSLFTRPRFELWWNSANRYSFRLFEPLQLPPQSAVPQPAAAEPRGVSEVVDRNNPEVEGRFKGKGSYRMSFVPEHPDNGDSVLKVEVSGSKSQIEPVDWKLEIKAQRVSEQTDLHAWIERDGPPTSRFVNHAEDTMTLTVPGTAYSVIAVGAIRAAAEIELGYMSSYGPTRDERKKPELVAPGMGIKGARGETADDVIDMSGTSMAAPHVAGAVALALSKMARSGRTKNSQQIIAIIRRTTKNYHGVHDRGHGFGVLDVKAFLAEF
jgi:subtilisin family serine protease/tetratricopeptide (TPR) repeat protein